MKQLCFIAGKRKAGTTFLFHALQADWKPSTKDRSWPELSRDLRGFLDAGAPATGVVAKADALLSPERLVELARLPDLRLRVILVDRTRRERLLSFIAHERKGGWVSLDRLRAQFQREERGYQEGLARLREAGVSVMQLDYHALTRGEVELPSELAFSPSDRVYNSKTQSMPFGRLIRAVTERPVYVRFRERRSVMWLRALYYRHLVRSRAGDDAVRLALLGSMKGPIDGQRRLTSAFRYGTGFRTYAFEFNGHRRLFGPAMIVWQGLRAAGLGLFARLDGIYIAVSRTPFGMFRDLAIMLPLRLSGARTIAHVHGAEFESFFLREKRLAQVKRLYLRQLDDVIFIHESLVPSDGSLAGKARVVRNPIPDFAAEGAGRHSADAASARTKRSFGFISSFVPGKGIEHFIDASRDLGERATFVVAGGPNSRFPDYGRHISARLKGQAGIINLGYLTSPMDFYEKVDFAVFPSSYASEAVPGVVIEALATGTVPIVLAHNHIPHVFAGAPVIWLKTVEELPDAVSRAIDLPEAELSRMKTQGIEWAHHEFPSEAAWIARLEDILLDPDARSELRDPAMCSREHGT